MAITNITPLPTPPTRQDPANFAERADTFLAALPTFTTEVNTAGDQIEAAEQAAKNAQAAAENAANAAARSADSASVTANAAVWVSGSAYSQYSNAIDPVDYRTYRAKNAVTSTTRPALDSTNWALLSAQGDVTTDTDQTITSVKTFTQPIVGSTTTQVLKAGDTMTGQLSVPAGASGTQVPQAQEVRLHTFPSGTKMLFAQTAAPTGWTKDTTHDNKALRVVTGTAGSGGSVAFTTAFASQAVAGTVGMTTLTVAQMPNHDHQLNHGTQNGPGGSGWNWKSQNAGAVDRTNGTGGNEGHNHSFTGTAINLAVQYVDVIIATKN